MRRKRLKKTLVTTPRLATLMWLRDLQQQLHAQTGKTLKDFDQKDKLLNYDVFPNGEVVFTDTQGLDRIGVPGILLACSGCESKQVSGISYLTHKQKLAIASLWDPHHCSHNATWDAVVAVGFQAAIEQGIIIVNVPIRPVSSRRLPQRHRVCGYGGVRVLDGE